MKSTRNYGEEKYRSGEDIDLLVWQDDGPCGLRGGYPGVEGIEGDYRDIEEGGEEHVGS